MKKYILGLDIGITSVGWGIIDEENNIIEAGVRLFEEADSENNVKRRGFRSNRRLKRRKALRILDIKDLLYNEGLIEKDFKSSLDPYLCRKKGLTEKLSNEELAVALIHLAKRRGSSLETVEDEKVSEESPKFVLNQHDYQLATTNKYVVDLQLEALEAKQPIRGFSNVYRTTQYLDEVKQLLSNQGLSEDINAKIISVIKRRRHFSEGPGSVKEPTPFGRFRFVDATSKKAIIESFNENQKKRFKKEKFTVNYNQTNYVVLKTGDVINKDPLNLIDLMKGKCSLFEDEFRAAKMSYSAELHNLLNDLNNLTIKSENRKLTTKEKEMVVDVIKHQGDFKPKGVNGLLKLLNLKQEDVSGFRVKPDKEIPLVTEFKGYNKLLKPILKHDASLIDQIDVLDEIAEILTKTQVIVEREEELKNFIENEHLIDELKELSGFNGYHSFSKKALRLLNAEMMIESKNQQELISKNALKAQQETPKLELNENLILSPVAKRAHREALKVVNELIDRYGDFRRIVIETTRDKNSKEQKSNISKAQKRNEDNKKKAFELLEQFGYSADKVSAQVGMKLRLYNEQQGKCAYTGLPIDINLLIKDPRAYEVDHIIPYSISLDDSLNNKVLVTPAANQLKGNKTPFMYFTSGKIKDHFPIQSYDTFREVVSQNNNYNRYKKDNLLFEEDITSFSVLEGFRSQNLVDTSYAVRSFMGTLKAYFDYNDIPTTVVTIKGKQTNNFRALGKTVWYRNHAGITETPFDKNRDIYMHHAVDALIIAGLSNQKTVKYLLNMEKDKDSKLLIDQKTGELFDYDPKEDSDLIKFLLRIGNLEKEDIRYAWKRDSKPNRSFSDQTIYSTRQVEDTHYVVKKYKDIYEMKKEDLKKVFEDEKKSNNLLVKKHDPNTFEILKKIYETYKNEPKPFAAYKKTHGKVRKFGKNGPEITSLKYLEDKLGNHVDVTQNYHSDKKKVVLLQLSTFRVDIYETIEGQYKFLTIRYNDLSQKNGKYCIKEETYNQIKELKGIKDSDKFMFSLYRNDAIKLKVQEKEGINELNYRFISCNNDNKNILEFKSIAAKDSKQVTITIGKKITSFEKFNVTPAGKVYKVLKEELKFNF